MSERLPEQVDPLRLARQGARVEGVLPLSHSRRLAEYLSETPGEATVVLEFGLGEGVLGYLRGHVQAQLTVICQRCLEPMTMTVEAPFAFGLVVSEAEADRLGDDYEPLLVGDEPLRLGELIEDELILALPVVALHDMQDCPAAQRLETKDPAVDERRADASPFAVLKELKRQN